MARMASELPSDPHAYCTMFRAAAGLVGSVSTDLVCVRSGFPDAYLPAARRASYDDFPNDSSGWRPHLATNTSGGRSSAQYFVHSALRLTDSRGLANVAKRGDGSIPLVHRQIGVRCVCAPKVDVRAHDRFAGEPQPEVGAIGERQIAAKSLANRIAVLVFTVGVEDVEVDGVEDLPAWA